MKKRNFFILSAAALLALCACGGNSGKSNKGGDSSKEPDAEEKGYVDPVVDLKDAEEATFDIDFDEVEDTCMINPKAKTYIDQMEEQEKTLDRPYHFSSLYGPEDYAKMAAAADKGDGTTYAAEDTGGVDVCQILNRNDYSNDCKNYPIKLTWDDDGTFEGAKVKFWSTEDQSDLRETDVTISNGKVTAELANLFRARKYRVQVFVGDDVSNSYEFTTGDYPRTLTMGGIHNVRDIGGYVTSYGVRTNQGLMYRGYYIDDKSGGHGVNYSAEAQKVQDEVMKIGVEIDLQKSSETNGRTASAISSATAPCDYVNYTLISYENFLKKESYQNLPAVMKLMAHSDEKHTYFHCWGGADRTGMLAFFVNAICGVSYTDLMEDFELTTQTNNKRCHMHNSSSAHYPKFMNAFINGYTEDGKTWDGFDPEKTVNENCEKWLLEIPEDKDGNKVDPEDIERIREIMLPGYAEGKLQKDKLIPTYTAKAEWKSDELAHWHEAEEDANVKCDWHRHDGKECSICGYGASSQPGGNSSAPAGDSQSTAVDYTEVQPHVWTVTKKENNSDGKEYEQLVDPNNKVGVRILQSAISSTSVGSFDDGKLPKEADMPVTYQVKAPKAGTYQMVMNGRVSDASYMLGKRGITITVNGQSVAIDGDNRDGGLVGTGDNDFVIAPSVTLTGNEDTITVACRYYRIQFNQSAYLVFAEH